jgi:soluble lytic murein transglycosylase-like protein
MAVLMAGSMVVSAGHAEASSMTDGCPEIIHAYFGDAAPRACAIAWCESRWNPNAISYTHDYGLFQINRIHGLGLSALDPETNVAFAYRLSKGGADWSAWSCA